MCCAQIIPIKQYSQRQIRAALPPIITKHNNSSHGRFSLAKDVACAPPTCDLPQIIFYLAFRSAGLFIQNQIGFAKSCDDNIYPYCKLQQESSLSELTKVIKYILN